MKLAVISFTRQGSHVNAMLTTKFLELGESCTGYVMNHSFDCGKEAEGLEEAGGSLKEWTGERFSDSDGLIFVGAAGIAVRAIAPFVRDKMTDPAVVVVDETMRFSISLLSGHMGGANELALLTAELTGAEPVITTATDVNGRFAVDVFARQSGLFLENRETAKRISADVLEGRPVGFYSDFPIEGVLPEGMAEGELCGRNIWISSRSSIKGMNRIASVNGMTGKDRIASVNGMAGKDRVASVNGMASKDRIASVNGTAGTNGADEIDGVDETGHGTEILQLIPKVVAVGIGCRKGTDAEVLYKAVTRAFALADRHPYAAAVIASIDLKKEEPGLISLAGRMKIPLETFTADQLLEVPGIYTESAFVEKITGVDNVCERAAMRAVCGDGGRLILKKQIYDGVTVALAEKNWKVQV